MSDIRYRCFSNEVSRLEKNNTKNNYIYIQRVKIDTRGIAKKQRKYVRAYLGASATCAVRSSRCWSSMSGMTGMSARSEDGGMGARTRGLGKDKYLQEQMGYQGTDMNTKT